MIFTFLQAATPGFEMERSEMKTQRAETSPCVSPCPSYGCHFENPGEAACSFSPSLSHVNLDKDLDKFLASKVEMLEKKLL